MKSAFAIGASEDKIDQLYIIQQGGRNVKKEDIIEQLENAIAKDAESVFKAKPELWEKIRIYDSKVLKQLCHDHALSRDPKYEPFRNIILTTK
ncbi:chaperone HtpG [Bacteroides pyogenes]|nr:chaperone HtpG [Bacteroides pyogenes]